MAPLSWKHMSVGEEQSELFCSSIAWSPPGLGKHKRCLLTVLTANHILSLWECTGRPEGPADWIRVCIINHALQTFASHNDTDDSEKRKMRQRIRSFSWSHSPYSAVAAGFSGASVALSHPYLAVSNDLGEVFIVKIKTPHDLLSIDDTDWTASIIQTFAFQPNPAKRAVATGCMPIHFKPRKAFVDQLTWSPWTKDATGNLSSVLAMTFQSSLHCRFIRAGVTADDTMIELGPAMPRMFDDSSNRPAGQMRWMPELSPEGELYLLYPCRRTLYCLVFQLRKGTGVRVTRQPLNNVWDELSGESLSVPV